MYIGDDHDDGGGLREWIRGGIFTLVASSLSLVHEVGVKFEMAVAHYWDRVPPRFYIEEFKNYSFLTRVFSSYTLHSVPSIRFHFHPVTSDKDKTSAPKLPSLSTLRLCFSVYVLRKDFIYC